MEDAVTIRRTVNGSSLPFTIERVDDKLRWRASLPGASAWDRAAQSLRLLQAEGAGAMDLLALSLPASWLVDSKASSRTMHRWLSRSYLEPWSVIFDVIGRRTLPEDWLVAPTARREAVAEAVATLVHGAPDGPPLAADDGASLAAVTKTLALLRPQTVPMMDDAALAFALELVPMPATPGRPTAKASAFVPMMDWFARQVAACEPELYTIAARHELSILDAAQVLDRLVWMESWGNRLRARLGG